MKRFKYVRKRSMALFVALAMCFSLLPATAFASELQVIQCGITAHAHTLDCYAKEGAAELVCTLEETEDTTEEVEVEVPVYETVDVVDEETGESTGETVKVQIGTETVIETNVVPGHTHGDECYVVTPVLVCGLEEHTHDDSCYTGDVRDVETDDDGNIVPGEDGQPQVSNPDSISGKAEEIGDDADENASEEPDDNNADGGDVDDGEEPGDDESTPAPKSQNVTVTWDEETGTWTVTDEDGNVIDIAEGSLDVKKDTRSEVVKRTPGKAGETTVVEEEHEVSRVTDEETGVTTIITETTYQTTYTVEETTGIWVTYTITYTVKEEYIVENGGGLDVDVDDEGNLTVKGFEEDAAPEVEFTFVYNDGTAETVKSSVYKGNDGNFYVDIDGTPYQVVASISEGENKDGKISHTVSWVFAEGVEPPTRTRDDITFENDGVIFNEETKEASLGETVTVDEKTFKKAMTAEEIAELGLTAEELPTLGDDEYYIVVEGQVVVAKLELILRNDGTYVVKYNYTYTTTEKVTSEDAAELPKDVSTTWDEENGLTVTGPNGTTSTKTVKVGDEEYTIESVSSKQAVDEDGNLVYDEDGNPVERLWISCTDNEGNYHVFVISTVTPIETEDGKGGYDLSYQLLTTVKVPKYDEDAKYDEAALEAIAKYGYYTYNGKTYKREFVAITLPDGTVIPLAVGPIAVSGGWGSTKYVYEEGLPKGEMQSTGSNSVIFGHTVEELIEASISYDDDGQAYLNFECPIFADYNESVQRKSLKNKYRIEGLNNGDTVEHVILSLRAGVIDNDTDYDYFIVELAGLVIKDAVTGELKSFNLVVRSDGTFEVTTPHNENGTASVGKKETKSASGDTLTGDTEVIVTTKGGETYTMTYEEYLEHVSKGEDDLTLTGVVQKSYPDPQPEPLPPVLEPIPVGGDEEEPEEEEPEEDPVTPPTTPTNPSNPNPPYNPPVQNNQDAEEPEVEATEPEIEVEEPEVPLAAEPEAEEPVIEVEEPEVPLAAEPEEEEPVIEIADPEVPLSAEPEAEEVEIEIADPEVPLADVPHTGDESAIWTLMTLLSAAGMICMMAIERKKREEN